MLKTVSRSVSFSHFFPIVVLEDETTYSLLKWQPSNIDTQPVQAYQSLSAIDVNFA
jgi:hypothetical protein